MTQDLAFFEYRTLGDKTKQRCQGCISFVDNLAITLYRGRKLQNAPLEIRGDLKTQKYEFLTDGKKAFYLQIAQVGKNDEKIDKILNLETGRSWFKESQDRAFDRMNKVYGDYIYDFVKDQTHGYCMTSTDIRNPDLVQFYKLPFKRINETRTTTIAVVRHHETTAWILGMELDTLTLKLVKIDLAEDYKAGKKIEVFKTFTPVDKEKLKQQFKLANCKIKQVAISNDYQQVCAIYACRGQENRRLDIFDVRTQD
jgi:hypothetical protein